MKKGLMAMLALAMALGLQPAVAAPATEKSVRELMEVTGAGDAGMQMLNGILPALKQMAPNAPDEFWEEFMAEVDPDSMIDLIVPIYQRHYSEEDLQAAIDFYTSPAGKRFIAKQGVVMQESMQAGQQWGEQIARRAFERLQQRSANP